MDRSQRTLERAHVSCGVPELSRDRTHSRAKVHSVIHPLSKRINGEILKKRKTGAGPSRLVPLPPHRGVGVARAQKPVRVVQLPRVVQEERHEPRAAETTLPRRERERERERPHLLFFTPKATSLRGGPQKRRARGPLPVDETHDDSRGRVYSFGFYISPLLK